LLVGNQSSLVLNPALYSNAGYDAKADFVDLGMVATYPYVLVAREDLGVKSYAELAQMARSRELTIATAGPGTIQHILAAALADAAGIKLMTIHYKGAGAAYLDVLGGRVDLFIDAWPSV